MLMSHPVVPHAGEQQRLGMARLFFHSPRFGVLDECTNATSVDVEELLYQHAASLGITLVIPLGLLCGDLQAPLHQ